MTFENLPEQKQHRYGSAQHWREHCLIKAGFRHEVVQPVESQQMAQQMALFVAILVMKRLKRFVVAYAAGATVVVLVARTQKMLKNDPDGMDKKDFEASKQAVLEICAAQWPGLMTVDQLLEEAKRQMG